MRYWKYRACWARMFLICYEHYVLQYFGVLFFIFCSWFVFLQDDTLNTEALNALCFDLLTRPKMPFKVMHRKEVTHSNGSYERKSRGRKLADEMGRGKKEIPWYSDKLMHRKRVTSELHDSYFHLMIRHLISKIEWASNDFIIQLSSMSQ